MDLWLSKIPSWGNENTWDPPKMKAWKSSTQKVVFWDGIWDSSWEGTASREGYHRADGKGIQYLQIQIGEPKILPKVIGKN